MTVKECKKCPYCQRFSIGDYRWFYGCTYFPFHGRRMADISKCPKEEAEKAMMGGEQK